MSLFKCRDVLNRLHVVNSGSAEDRGLATAVASALIRVAFVKGDFIIREGLESDSMYFVVEGEVEVLGGADGSGSRLEELLALLEASDPPLTAGQRAFCNERTLLRYLVSCARPPPPLPRAQTSSLRPPHTAPWLSAHRRVPAPHTAAWLGRIARGSRA